MHLEIGKEYYWKRTPSWRWIDGTERWWEVFIRIIGLNGLGGCWVVELWRWNSSSEVIREQARSLSSQETQDLAIDFEANSITRSRSQK